MNLTDLAAELLGQPVDQFTSRRNARVKELKASGQADLARDLAALKKPSLSLWAANQVRDRELLAELRKAAEAIVKAQAGAASGRANAARDLRAASEELQRRLEAAGEAAAAALRRDRHPESEETLRRIREIFRLAALQGGETWERLQKGALTTEPQPAGDMLEMFGAGASAVADGETRQAEARRASERAEKAARADAELAERAAATARRLRQEAADAAAALRRAQERAAAAEEEAARARTQAEKSGRAARRRP